MKTKKINGENNDRINANENEYEFDIDDIKNPNAECCIKCERKYTNAHELTICNKFLYELLITKTDYKINMQIYIKWVAIRIKISIMDINSIKMDLTLLIRHLTSIQII